MSISKPLNQQNTKFSKKKEKGKVNIVSTKSNYTHVVFLLPFKQT